MFAATSTTICTLNADAALSRVRHISRGSDSSSRSSTNRSGGSCVAVNGTASQTGDLLSFRGNRAMLERYNKKGANKSQIQRRILEEDVCISIHFSAQ